LKFNGKYWNDYSSYIKRVFGKRVQKISVNAGFSCPNKTKSNLQHGCLYCNNQSFSPFYCDADISIKEQLIKGIEFFGEKYQSQQYLAYFQTGTNTYADVELLENYYYQALDIKNVIGLVIGTRPDCLNNKNIALLSNIARKYYLSLEIGAESTKNKTLELINRGHTWQQTVNAVKLANTYDINVCLHFIIGLPGENEEDFYMHAREISKLKINSLKLHQMQILRGTKLEEMYKEKPDIFYNLTIEKYADIIVKFCELLNPEIIIERFTSESPKDLIISPDWKGKKNFEISHIIEKRFKELNTYQARLYNK
jgi:uncharacterized protein